MRLPQKQGPVTFTIDRGESWNPYARTQLSLEPTTAAVVRWEPYASASAGRKLRIWARGLHTGEPGGVPGQAAAGLASLGGAVLVWTGHRHGLATVARLAREATGRPKRIGPRGRPGARGELRRRNAPSRRRRAASLPKGGAP